MDVEFEQFEGASGLEGIMILKLDRDEASLLYFAMRAYIDTLEKSLEQNSEVRAHFFEEGKFLHDTLGKAYGFLFNMIDNHEPTIRQRIRSWMDVI